MLLIDTSPVVTGGGSPAAARSWRRVASSAIQPKVSPIASVP